ncbi:UdgX family uracil-DNA binding protein [Novosphingobium resinovorum]|uniref:UdgX family uracil-DNA binding protein n=1 Tax=Novosphingobium resinovorum TaxID=158500 RepID=UPI002ED38EC1|nr:UdgX family uracil-DNA binding protein [Novosphingobium resinovorum]
MIATTLAEPDDFEAWRAEARRLVERGVSPDAAGWHEDTADLFAAPAAAPVSVDRAREVRASRAFMNLARSAVLHSDPARLGLLYRVLWRLQEHPRLLDDAADRDVAALERLARQVRRDIHKMRAFVRFRTMPLEDGPLENGPLEDGGERFVAWFEPDHRIERANAAFFVNRFASQQWSILTPRLSLHWDGAALLEGPPATRADAPAEDATEELWLGYYRSIFNPARLKIGMMVREMPRRYWKNLPEARAIPELVAGAQQREAAMIATGTDLFAAETPPASLSAVAEGIARCRRCAIGCNGTRAVVGEGPASAGLMIIGEQPGDTEEREGRPFVGPAGQLLDAALATAGVDRARAYVTNAVKHFKFAPRGKRRLHQAPTAGEIDMCRWWLDAERALVRPRVILALGASSARGLLGRTPAIGRERGQAIALPDGGTIWLTAHPSYLLRLDGEAREREHGRFAQDLAGLARLLGESA